MRVKIRVSVVIREYAKNLSSQKCVLHAKRGAILHHRRITHKNCIVAIADLTLACLLQSISP